MKRLAIIITHPIQYYVPFFVLLAKACKLKVFYTIGKDEDIIHFDPKFKREIKWDIPLLSDYTFEFVTNTAKDPGSHHYKGIVNPSLINNIKKFDPDAILIYGWAYHGHLSAMRYFKNKTPLWFKGDSNLLDERKGSLKLYLRLIFLKWVYQHIDYAFYVGSANKCYYERFGLKARQLVFSPHAVDNKRFSADRREESEQLRKELGIATSEILVLFAGKLEPKKNPQLLLKAFDVTHATGIHLLFVGNGVLEQKLKEQAKKQLRNCIHFMDFQNQSTMPVVYQACDLFCLPSQGPAETWGLAVNEAMAAGKAVLVSTMVGCAADLVKASVNGEIFESENIDDLVDKLSTLTDNKEKLAKMGIQSQQIIQNWSFEKQVKAIVDTIYNNDAK